MVKFIHNDEYYNIIHSANTANKAFILAKQKKKGGYQTKWTVNKVEDKRTLNDVIDFYKHVEIRHDWEEVKLDIMEKAVFAKFSLNARLKNLLLSTGDNIIIENSPRDSYWV